MDQYPSKREVKSKKSIKEERSSYKSLKLDFNRKKESPFVNNGTEVKISDANKLDDSFVAESSSQFSQDIKGDLGSPTIYNIKDSFIDPTFPPEAQGMAKILKNKTKAERLLLRLPSISNFVEESTSNMANTELREGLIFSFYKLMRKHLKNSVYRFLLSNKDAFADSLARFSRSGNYKELLIEIEHKHRQEWPAVQTPQDGPQQLMTAEPPHQPPARSDSEPVALVLAGRNAEIK